VNAKALTVDLAGVTNPNYLNETIHAFSGSMQFATL
jgi:hypothetical protein